MNVDKDKLFENHLRQAKPAAVDDILKQRIASKIRVGDAAHRASRWPVYVGWASLVAAASIMIVIGLTLFTTGDGRTDDPVVTGLVSDTAATTDYTVDADAFEPVLAQNNLKERIDEGIVFLDGGLTARKYRYQFIDRVVWRNPKSGARVEMQVPRDEVVLIPVQTY